MSAYDLRPVDLLDPAQEDAAREWLGVHSDFQREVFGDRGSAWTFEEMVAMHRQGDRARECRGVWVDDRVVGALEVQMPVHDNTSSAQLVLTVAPDWRRRGVGSALLAEALRICGAHGRAVVQVETEWAEGGADIGEPFARAHGFDVAQTVARSEMALPADRPRLAAVVAAPGAETYAFETFLDTMPEAWLEDRAHLQRRMSTDAPADDLVLEEEAWDARRVRETDARVLSAGRRIVETAARHVPTGHLVGFTRVAMSAGEPTLAYQQDTLVLTEHRGHALGLRLKAATALALMDAHPDVTAVRTWNAASNAPMLRVNRELGYVVDGWSREWQKHLEGEAA